MVLETWKGLKHARMCVVPFASHGVNLEEPEKVNAVIDLFLAELRVRGLDV
jgi:pimeloyl-ACP methyl ester carboxylesterase